MGDAGKVGKVGNNVGNKILGDILLGGDLMPTLEAVVSPAKRSWAAPVVRGGGLLVRVPVARRCLRASRIAACSWTSASVVALASLLKTDLPGT